MHAGGCLGLRRLPCALRCLGCDGAADVAPTDSRAARVGRALVSGKAAAIGLLRRTIMHGHTPSVGDQPAALAPLQRGRASMRDESTAGVLPPHGRCVPAAAWFDARRVNQGC